MKSRKITYGIMKILKWRSIVQHRKEYYIVFENYRMDSLLVLSKIFRIYKIIKHGSQNVKHDDT